MPPNRQTSVSARDAWQPPDPGRLQEALPQYEVIALVGLGGMGAVYKARQKSLNRLVAIKIMQPDLVDDELKFAERFKNEAQTIAQFNHPAIIHVHDYGETAEGLLYFVMEFVDGTDVAALIEKDGKLPMSRAVEITRTVCDALHYAHTRGVIHRDIKPANVLIDKDGEVKVADFGLAKMNDPTQATGLTRTNVAMGTQEFAAPEQLTPGAVVDHRADIYSLGVMLYQMLTAEVPRVMFKLPSRSRPELGTRFDALICKALETDPAERFQSAAEFRRELDAIAIASAAPANQSSAVKQGGHLGRRKLISAAVAAIVVFGVSGWFFLGHRYGHASLPSLEKSTENTPALSSSTLPHNEWIKLLDTPEAVARSGIKDLQLKDGWLTVTPERLYLFRLAGGKGKVPDMAFRATVRPPTNEWPIAVVLHAGADPEYFLHVYHDRLTLRRIGQPTSSNPAYTELGNVPLDLRQAKDGAFQLEASIQGNLITVMADGAKVMEVRDEGAAGTGDIALIARSETKGSGKIKDLAFKLLDESAVATEGQGRTIDLLALVDVKRDVVAGEWSLTPDGLALKDGRTATNGVESARLQLPYAPPADYDFEVDFTATTDNPRNIGQIVLAASRNPSWILATGKDQKAAGFELFDNAPVSRSTETAKLTGGGIEKGRRYRSRVEVRSGSLRAFLDDKEIVNWSGALKRLANDAHSALRDHAHLGLRAGCGIIFHKVEVREISGPGMPDWPAKATATPVPLDKPDNSAANIEQGRTIDLLPLVDVKRDTVFGEWNRDGGDLVVKAGASHSGSEGNPRLQLPYQPPEEYDFEFEFTPVAGGNNVYQLLSAYGRSFAWVMDVNMKVGKKAGFQLIGGANVLSLEDGSAVRDHFLTNGQRHRSKVEVRKTGVRGLLDDKPIVSWGTTPDSYQLFDIHPNDALRDTQHLGLAVTNRALRIHKVTVREITGTGKVDTGIPPRSASATGKTIDLLALVDVKRDAIVGEWSRTADGLAVPQSPDTANGSPRLQLPVTPPTEYDFEIEFTAGDGEGFVGQALSAAGHPFAWIVDMGLIAGRKAGFGMLNGKLMMDSTDASIMRKQLLTNGRRHVSRVEVRKGKATAYLDGEKLVDWGGGRGDFAHFDIHPNNAMRDAQHLGIIASDRAVTFHKITLRDISGTGSSGKSAAAWTDWLGPKLKKPDSLPTGMVSAPDGVSTEKEITGYEILPQGTSDAAMQVTYVLRDSTGVSLCLRGDPPGKTGESYLAEDNGSFLQLSKVQPGAPYKTLLKKPVPAEWIATQERALEFSVIGDTLTATLNGSLVATVRDTSLASGHGTVLLRRNLLLKKVEFQVPATPTAPHNPWMPLLDTPEAVARSGVTGLELKDGWLTLVPERLYLVRLAGGKDKVRDMAFQATIHPPTNEWPITAILRAGANPQYNLDVHHDRLTLNRVAQVAAAKPVYTQLGNVPLDLRQAKDGAFLLGASIEGNLITIMADGAKVMEVCDEGAAGAGDIALATPSEANGSGKIKDLAFKMLDESRGVTEAHGRTSAATAPAESFRPLFDGKSLDGWLSLNGVSPPDGWRVVDGTLTGKPYSAVLTREEYGDFDLSLEWRVNPQGNGGVFYRVAEDGMVDHPLHAVEFNLMDENISAPPLKRCGAAFGVKAPSEKAAHPVGEWNTARLLVQGTKVEQWINDKLVCSYDLTDESVREGLEQAGIGAGFAAVKKGRIALQDWQGEAFYRNVRIRELRDDDPH